MTFTYFFVMIWLWKTVGALEMLFNAKKQRNVLKSNSLDVTINLLSYLQIAITYTLMTPGNDWKYSEKTCIKSRKGNQ